MRSPQQIHVQPPPTVQAIEVCTAATDDYAAGDNMSVWQWSDEDDDQNNDDYDFNTSDPNQLQEPVEFILDSGASIRLCRCEGRYPTDVTGYCISHNACLCKSVYPREFGPHICDNIELTCWQKPISSTFLPVGDHRAFIWKRKLTERDEAVQSE